MSDLITDLKALRELLTPPGQWTQGAYARDAEGNRVGVRAENVRCYCLTGAMSVVIRSKLVAPGLHLSEQESLKYTDGAYMALRGALMESLPGPHSTMGPLVTFNDSASHAQVLDLIDRTIARVAFQ